MSADSEFQKAMIAYPESAHVGEFLTGTMAEVKAQVPYVPKQRRGMHDIIADSDDSVPSMPANSPEPIISSFPENGKMERSTAEWSATCGILPSTFGLRGVGHRKWGGADNLDVGHHDPTLQRI
ncbi:hypothetical protein B0H13DRAFT_2302530 [Mycena leptocephala]|nr:hypothetical protein B0H13DRAFT_2302530 [Mycena leptocephala]